MPRAEAKLLTMDDVSRCSCRLCPGSRGGCCWESVAAAGLAAEVLLDAGIPAFLDVGCG
jgi:hypothetical protein